MKNKKILIKDLHNLKMKEYEDILRKDRDFDWEYILVLLSYKLKRTKNCISEKGTHENASVVANQIEEVENLLNRVIENRYLKDISSEFEAKYGKLNINFKKTLDRNAYTIESSYSKTSSPKECKNAREDSITLFQIARYMRQDDLDLAFNMMAKNIQNWWD
ncbi:MAG: hypothetical protein WC635_12125 [Bacteriovorax sp.]|jgi:hypothetical protein